MQRGLTQSEEKIIQAFAQTNTAIILDNDFVSVSSWRATLGVMARCVIDMVKHDMCSNPSSISLEIATTIKLSFREGNINDMYMNEMISLLYYIAGWHLTACLKAGRIRTGKEMNSNLGKLMILLFECASVDQKDANNLPTEKVV